MRRFGGLAAALRQNLVRIAQAAPRSSHRSETASFAEMGYRRSRRVISELRLWPDHNQQINHLPAARGFGEGQVAVGVRALLQHDSDTLIVGQGRARAPERAAAKPGQGGGGATCGWAPSRIPPKSGVSRSDK